MNRTGFLFFAFGELRMGLFTLIQAFFFFLKENGTKFEEKNAMIAMTCNNRYFSFFIIIIFLL